MVRENAIITMGSVENRPDYDYGENAELRLYALQEDKEASAVIYGMHQEKELEITALRHGSEINIHVETEKSYTLRFVNLRISASSVTGLRMAGADSLLTLSGTQILTVSIAEN